MRLDEKNACDFCGFIEYNPIIVATPNLEAHPSGKVTLCGKCSHHYTDFCFRCRKRVLREDRHWFEEDYYCDACLKIVQEETAERELAEWERVEGAKYARWTKKCEDDWERKTGEKLPFRFSNGLKEEEEEW